MHFYLFIYPLIIQFKFYVQNKNKLTQNNIFPVQQGAVRIEKYNIWVSFSFRVFSYYIGRKYFRFHFQQKNWENEKKYSTLSFMQFKMLSQTFCEKKKQLPLSILFQIKNKNFTTNFIAERNFPFIFSNTLTLCLGFLKLNIFFASSNPGPLSYVSVFMKLYVCVFETLSNQTRDVDFFFAFSASLVFQIVLPFFFVTCA